MAFFSLGFPIVERSRLDDSTEVWGKRSNWADETVYGTEIEGKVFVVGESLLEGAGSLVAGVLRVHGWIE